MLQLVLATLCSLSTESRAVTFDEAKADASKRMAYLGQLLDGKVFDKDKNPNGLIKAWYFVADEKQKVPLNDWTAECRAFESKEEGTVLVYTFGQVSYRTTEPNVLEGQLLFAKPLKSNRLRLVDTSEVRANA